VIGPLGALAAINLESSALMSNGLKRLLIVSPHFPPVNAADMQRVRMLLPFFKQNGWQVEVLAVAPEQTTSPRDEWLLRGIPGDIPVHHARALGLAWSHIPGLGSLGFRAMRAFARAGSYLLKERKFDLIYFSTTVFELHILGPRWKKKFNVPFVIDYQDPWVNDYYRDHPEITPPGGRLKFAIIDRIHRWMEPRVLKECAGITAVASAYPEQIRNRYPWLKNIPTLIQPFCAAKSDWARLADARPLSTSFEKSDGSIHWVYVGVVVPMMELALRSFFRALQSANAEKIRNKLKIYFIGTSYAPPGTAKPGVLPLAKEYGLDKIVHESCARVPYSDALNYMRSADALLAFGTNDLGYTASKIYPYLLARRPLLAIYNENSSVIKILNEVGGGVCVPFNNDETIDSVASRVNRYWLCNNVYRR